MNSEASAKTPFGKILIIGGRSFFARYLFDETRRRYPSAIILRSSRFENAESGWVELEPTDWSSVRQVVTRFRPDLVINSSGVTSGSFHGLLKTNAIASSMIAGVVGDTIPEARLILLGSAAEYGVTQTPVRFSESHPLRGTSLYGISKKLQHSLLPTITKSAQRTIYLRMFNLVGRNMPLHSLFGKVLEIAKHRASSRDFSPIETGFLGDYRDFIDASIAARYSLVLAETEIHSGVVNVGLGECSQVREKLGDWLGEQGIDPTHIQLEENVNRQANYSIADVTRLQSLLSGFIRSPH